MAIYPSLLFSTLAGGFILVSFYFLASDLRSRSVRRAIIKRHHCEPPPRQPVKDPFLGLDIIYDTVQAVKSKTFIKNRDRQFELYGNTFSSRLSTASAISTIEPENIKAVLSTNFKDYVVGYPRRNAFYPALGNSLFVADGADWEHSRSMLRPSFNRSQINDLNTLEKHVEALIHEIPTDGSTIDLADLFTRFTADVTTDFLFGESIRCLPYPEAFGGDLATALRDAQQGGERRFRLGPLANIVPQRSFYRAIRKVHKYMDVHVDKAVKFRETQRQHQSLDKRALLEVQGQQADKKYVFMHELTKATTDQEMIRNELLGIFVAGRDTTSALLGNLFFHLARHPQIFQRLHDEIDQLGGKLPSLEDLKLLKYLNGCINETLRLYPVVVGSSRIAARDTVLPLGGGRDGKSPIFIAKGTLVMFHMHGLHQRKDIWGDDAAEFRPERWEDRKSSWDFLPFGGGPRNCIGQQFALLEALYTAARLLQQFSAIESRDPEPWTECLGASCCSANGVKVSLS